MIQGGVTLTCWLKRCLVRFAVVSVSIYVHLWLDCFLGFRLLAPGWTGTQEKLVGARLEPFGPALHDEVDQPPLWFDLGVERQRLLEQGLELLQVLFLHAHRLGEG